MIDVCTMAGSMNHVKSVEHGVMPSSQSFFACDNVIPLVQNDGDSSSSAWNSYETLMKDRVRFEGLHRTSSVELASVRKEGERSAHG